MEESLHVFFFTGSNFDDDEKKTTGGRNGYGAKLTNIFSKFVDAHPIVCRFHDQNLKIYNHVVYIFLLGNSSLKPTTHKMENITCRSSRTTWASRTSRPSRKARGRILPKSSSFLIWNGTFSLSLCSPRQKAHACNAFQWRVFPSLHGLLDLAWTLVWTVTLWVFLRKECTTLPELHVD